MRSGSVAATILGLLLAAGCGGSSAPSPSPSPSVTHGSPNFAQFLALPVATPRVCPTTLAATSDGRLSPWQGTVDVSVYAKPSDSTTRLRQIRSLLSKQEHVGKLFFESSAEAYQEYQRLYTCSAAVPANSLPASYRIVLTFGTTEAERDNLVAYATRLAGVENVACDPTDPCVATVRSANPGITKTK